jgi:SAM-dependent methyltransferase
MYGDLAWLWPIISPPEDYVEETELFSKTIKEHSKIEVKTLLHLGCGGGHNDQTFMRYFELTGIDISEEMLQLARELNPEVAYHRGDMRTIRLKESFDAVAILDSITYMSTEEDLRRAFHTAYEHLKPGGVFLTCVEECKEKFKQNKTQCTVHSRGDVNVAFVENDYDPDPTDTTFESTFVYIIRRRGEQGSRVRSGRDDVRTFHLSRGGASSNACLHQIVLSAFWFESDSTTFVISPTEKNRGKPITAKPEGEEKRCPHLHVSGSKHNGDLTTCAASFRDCRPSETGVEEVNRCPR